MLGRGFEANDYFSTGVVSNITVKVELYGCPFDIAMRVGLWLLTEGL